MPEHHALFMLREARIVRPEGFRSWRPTAPSTEASIQRIVEAARGAAMPYVYDVDGVEAKAAQFDIYQLLERAHVTPWVHSGCRTPEDVMDTFFAGAEAVTVELRHMDEARLGELNELAEGEIHLGVPWSRDAPRPRDLARIVSENGLAGIVLQQEAGKGLGPDAVVADLRMLGVQTSLLRTEPAAVALPERFDHLIEFPAGA